MASPPKKSTGTRLWPGNARIPPRYQYRRRLGTGGFGTLVVAWDQTLAREVALKILTSGINEESRGRFLREARILAQARSPYFVEVFDIEAEAEIPWISMELLDGVDLREGVPRQPLPPYLDIARGLEALHDLGVIHRDVKPANCFRTRAGRVLLIDFGLAKGQADPQVTRTGLVVGTPVFLAPELLDGEPCTPASDFYAWGVSLFEAFEGRVPFEIPPLPGIERDPLPFEKLAPESGPAKLLEACLDIDPNQRPTRVSELEAILAGEPLEKPTSKQPRVRPSSTSAKPRRVSPPPRPLDPRPPELSPKPSSSRSKVGTLAFAFFLLLPLFFWGEPPTAASNPRPDPGPEFPPRDPGPPKVEAPRRAWIRRFLDSPPKLDPKQVDRQRKRGEEPWAKPFLAWLEAGGEVQALSPEIRKDLSSWNAVCKASMPQEPFPRPWLLEPLPDSVSPRQAFEDRVDRCRKLLHELETTASERPQEIPGVRLDTKIQFVHQTALGAVLQSSIGASARNRLHDYLRPYRELSLETLHYGLLALDRDSPAERKIWMGRLEKLGSRMVRTFFGFPSILPLGQLLAWHPRSPEGRYFALRIESVLLEQAKLSGFSRRMQPRSLARAWDDFASRSDNPLGLRREAWFHGMILARADGAQSLFEAMVRRHRASFWQVLKDDEKAWIEAGLDRSAESGGKTPRGIDPAVSIPSP